MATWRQGAKSGRTGVIGSVLLLIPLIHRVLLAFRWIDEKVVEPELSGFLAGSGVALLVFYAWANDRWWRPIWRLMEKIPPMPDWSFKARVMFVGALMFLLSHPLGVFAEAVARRLGRLWDWVFAKAGFPLH